MNRPGMDWAPLTALTLAVALAVAGAGLLGSALFQAARHPTQAGPVASQSPDTSNAPTQPAESSPAPLATPSPSPTPTYSPTPTPTPEPPAVECWFGDFPYYPGSLAVAASTAGGHAWHVYAPASQVADYFTNGASQLAWQFDLISRTASQWNYRMSRAPSCTGSFFVRADPAGGVLFQATPDS